MERNYVNIKNSFKILVNHIKEKGIDHSLLVICGDIFEYKSYLEPGDIFHYKAICSLLKKENIKTLIIPGNHDYNNNSEIMLDNVSLLTNDYDYPNIVCKNKTGNYKNIHDIYAIEHGDSVPIEVHVFSPIDKKIPDFGDDDSIKIAILHEPINYATYDNGETINDARFNAGDLKRYDYVLLGDIHLHQFLSPRIAYCGSFVQKTKGEGIYKGYILWDMTSGNGEFVPIPLKELYIRIDAMDDKADLPDIGEFQKIRHTSLFHKNCSDSFLEELKLMMSTKYGYINRIVNSNKLKRTREEEPLKEDISHEKIISELLKDDPLLPKIIDYHNQILLSRKEVTCTTYRLNYLYWSNIFCYGENNYIDFTKFKNNLIMLNGKNKEGKSSIIDILIRVLFNECERGYKEDIVNKSKSKGFIKFSFNIGDDEYVIEQVYHRLGRKQYHRLFKNGENITKDTIIQTYEYLTKTIGIGEYKNFVNLTTALQNRKFLVDMAPKDFISLITKITNVDVLKDVEEETRKEINTMKRMNKSYEEDLKNIPEVKEVDLQQLGKEVSNLKITKVELRKNISKITAKLIDLNKDYDNTRIPADLDDMDENVNKKLSELDNYTLSHLMGKYNFDTNKESLAEINKEIWEINGRLKTLQVIDIERIKYSNYDAIGMPANSIKEKINSLQVEIERLSDISYKPKSLFRNKDELNTILACYVPNELIPLEKCDIDNLMILNESYKNEELLKKGLPDYSMIAQSIVDLEQKIANFTTNFGSLEFNDGCNSCINNRSKVYGIFDIKKEMGNLSILKSSLSQKDILTEQYQRAVEYNRDQNMNLIFLNNEDIKKKNEEILNTKKIYDDAIKELKELENYDIWNRLEKCKASKLSYEEMLNKYIEKDLQNIILKLDDMLKLKEYISIKLEHTLILKLINIRNSNKDKISTLEKLETMKTVAEKSLDDTINQINEKYEAYQISKSKFDNRNFLMEKITNNVSHMSFLETYSKVVSSKTGIPSYIIHNTCKSVQERCNKILGKITDFTIDIVFDKDIKIYTVENDIRIPAQMASGMQKFVMDLIFRITLTEISSISCTRTLFVDEGFGALDKENFINIANILQKLKDNFDSLFIISHITELNSYVDLTVDIKKIGYLSKVQYGDLSDVQKTMALINFISDTNETNKEFKEDKKRIKLIVHDDLIQDYCNENGGMEAVLFGEVDGKIYCKACDKSMKANAGVKVKHISAKTYNSKHVKYIRSLFT